MEPGARTIELSLATLEHRTEIYAIRREVYRGCRFRSKRIRELAERARRLREELTDSLHARRIAGCDKPRSMRPSRR
ncbi:MAG: hypothetical protein DMF95_09395 [Acidobacteria bacterium]|nr:MAG: hypothetical protein DMF95_09395 [Acidobacteriota bacterium]